MLALALAGGAGLAPVAQAGRYHEGGRVLEVEPIVRVVRVNVPEQRCVERGVQRGHRRDSGAATLTGALLGGVVGHQLGSGRDAATLAGALVGGAIGHDLAGSRRGPAVVRDCYTVERYQRREEVVGYRVKYRYRGEVYWTQTREHPGRWIEVGQPGPRWGR